MPGKPPIQFVDLSLARRLEMVTARSGKECAQVYAAIAGGIATFSGIDSPITQAFGVGLFGPVAEAELDRLEDFFFSRGAPVALELCPFIHPTLVDLIKSRPYRLEEFSNVLVRRIEPSEKIEMPGSSVEVRRASPQEAGLYSGIVTAAFSEYHPVSETLRRVVENFSQRPSGCCFLALVDGEIAAGACVSADQADTELAELYGAATLQRFRGLGAQSALIAARLRWAAQQGCALATTSTQPGSVSQRNYERAGFQVVYSRTKLVRNKG